MLNEAMFHRILLPLSGNLNDHVTYIYRKYIDPGAGLSVEKRVGIDHRVNPINLHNGP